LTEKKGVGAFAADFLVSEALAAVKESVALIDRLKLQVQCNYENIYFGCLLKLYGEICSICFTRTINEGRHWGCLWRENSANVIRHISSQALNLAFRDYIFQD